MTLNELIAMAKENGIDFDSEIDWDFDADGLYSENTELSCSVNNGSLELFFKFENEKDPSTWLRENFKKVEEVLKTFNLEIDCRDGNELDIKVPTFDADFRRIVIDKLEELVPEYFFFEDVYGDNYIEVLRLSRKTEKKGLELFFKTLYNKRVMSEKLKAL